MTYYSEDNSIGIKMCVRSNLCVLFVCQKWKLKT